MMARAHGQRTVGSVARWCIILPVMLLAAATLTAGCSSDGNTTTAVMVAPDFSGINLDGEEVSLSDYRGKPLVLVFMASWCGPCREESPELELFYQENGDEAALLAVAVDDPEADIRAFMSENDLTFPVMLNGDRTASAYGVAFLPTTVVIDSEGRIARRLVGGTTAAGLSLIVDGITR